MGWDGMGWDVNLRDDVEEERLLGGYAVVSITLHPVHMAVCVAVKLALGVAVARGGDAVRWCARLLYVARRDQVVEEVLERRELWDQLLHHLRPLRVAVARGGRTRGGHSRGHSGGPR